MHLAARLGAQLRVAVFLLCMLFLILKAYMQRLWEMIAILFSINPPHLFIYLFFLRRVSSWLDVNSQSVYKYLRRKGRAVFRTGW